MKSGDHLFLVDGSSYIFRAFHALPPLTRKSDGLPVGAVAGFCNMLWKLMQEGDPTNPDVKPTHMAVIFDYSSKTFRNDIYAAYKAHRPEPPEDLRPQFGVIREATRAFSLACIEQEGYEADDLIATYACEARAGGADVTIISSDKDLMQIVGDGVVMVDTMKTRRIDVAEVHEKFGVGPDKVIDVQSLAGDSTDNIPGVPGIGIKTAAQLIQEFGELDTLLEQAETIKQKKRRENLIEFAEQARISRKLVTLDQKVPVEVPLDDTSVVEFDPKKAVGFLKFMEFTTLTRRVGEQYDMDLNAVDPAPFEIAGWSSDKPVRGPDLDAGAAPSQSRPGRPSDDRSLAPARPADLAESRAAEALDSKFDASAYECVTTLESLDAWIAEALELGVVAVDTETTSLDAMAADLVGVSLATAPGRACYIPLAHVSGDDMFGGDRPDQVPMDEALRRLKALLEDKATLKVAQNLKYDWLVLIRYGIEVAPFDDTMLISYALDAGKGGHGMDELSDRWLGHKPIPFKEVAGSGKNMITFDKVPLDKATAYAAEDADVTLRLWRVLKPRLAVEGLTEVYERLERPMVPCLGSMEREGIKVDRQMLSRLSGDFAQKMAALEAEIHELAGESFNVGSPKQVGDILFGKMSLPGGTKTKTGAWSTGASVLEDLAAAGHELPQKLLDWRQVSKLKSTYTDALPGYINAQTKRVHTSFSLASTTTGRLSSSEPNVQNIPVRTETGREIRRAFIAEPGHKLISADYSQIELRVLAHIADIPQLKQAFEDGLDIHALTASEMFGVPVEGMDPMVRRRAKAINFGIIYGISAFGLANQLGIGREEASAYIKTYFERFPGIKDYMDKTKRDAHANGYVTTVFGRRANYPEINTRNPNMRAFFERAAINAPIQGSAADIIRRAMVRMKQVLDAAHVDARMLLQVHDELIFEVPEDQVDAAKPIIVRTMEEATLPLLQLSVPLKVDAKAADNWEEAH